MPTGFPELNQLAPDEKLMLAAELWHEATNDAGAPPVDERILAVIEERLKHLQENPETGIPWEEVKRSLRRNG
jgi:putative addiction module component (TIGR02574 family)